MLTTEEILIRALFLLPNAKSWSKDLMCTDRKGRQVRAEVAQLYSPLGAIFAVCTMEYYDDINVRNLPDYSWQKNFQNAVKALEEFTGEGLNEWNRREDTTFVHVRKAFEMAIDFEQQKSFFDYDKSYKSA